MYCTVFVFPVLVILYIAFVFLSVTFEPFFNLDFPLLLLEFDVLLVLFLLLLFSSFSLFGSAVVFVLPDCEGVCVDVG